MRFWKVIKKSVAALLCITYAMSFFATAAAKTNVAVGKTITAGIYNSHDCKKTYLNDGDDETGVYYPDPAQSSTMTDNANGKKSSATDAWYRIDLGARYKIDKVVLKFTTKNWTTAYNYKISVSNSPDFTDYTTKILAQVGDEGSKSPFEAIGDGGYYRYVKLEKTSGLYSSGYERYTELEVWADENDVITESFPTPEATNVALDKPVTAGNWTASKPKTNINDGDSSTYVDGSGTLTDNKTGIPSDYMKGENWYQIDLGNSYAVECVRLYDDTNLWSSGYNIVIKLANTSDFSDGVEIMHTREYEAVEFPLEILCNAEYYRYIRIEKARSDMNLDYAITELEVWAKESTKIGSSTYNVAQNKPILAGMWDLYCPKTNLVDGDRKTFVYPGVARTDNPDGKVSTAGTAWYLIDLEEEYVVEKINLYNHADMWSGHNLRILASKNPEFADEADYDIIVDTGVDGSVAMPFSANVGEKLYRYIKLEKINGSKTAFDYEELEVIGRKPETTEDVFGIEEFEFVNSDSGDGEVFYNPMEVGIAGARVKVKNKSEFKQSAVLAVALYDDCGRLLECHTDEKTIPTGATKTLATGVDAGAAGEGYRLKAFLWNGIDKLMPIQDEKILEGQSKVNIYVATNGNDNADGSLQNPFRTIERAKQEVRKYNKYMSADIDVYLREGVYFQDKTLEFDENDSGHNGFYVNYKAYNNEDVTISGAVPVTGWTEYESGIYKAEIKGPADIRELYADGIKQKRAQSEEKITPLGFYTENGEKVGFRLPKGTKISENPEDVQLHFDRVFNTYVLNVTDMKKSGNEVIIKCQQPQFSASMSVGMKVTSGSMFYLENSLSELDNEGEFYYDRREGILYYKPEEGADINSKEIYVPVLEKLLTVKGSTLANKAENIAFSGMRFAHATWLEPKEIGLIIQQAQWTYLADERGSGQVGSNITLEACENIVLKDNVFTGLAMVGVGLKTGASNNTIEGNVFYDIGDSAITAGTIGDSFMETECEGINLAYGCETFATSPGSGGAISGNAYNGWHQEITHCATCGGCSGTKCSCEKCDYTKGYWQIDLGEPKQIDRIEVDARKNYEQSTTRRNFEILGSNDPDFDGDVKVLARCGPDIFDNEGTWSQNVMSSEKYRYVRVRKTVNEYFYLAEIRIIDFDQSFEKHKEVCKNNVISNNYITNVGDYNHSAPGIQCYYTEGTKIRNNLIEKVPYSGIAMGWGWDTIPDSVTAKNNIIENNVIDTFGRIIIDGAGIYALGQQPGSIMRGNYIKNQVNECGTIYPDDGSRYWNIYNNVIENADMWMFIWSSNKQDITVRDNFTTTPIDVNYGTNCTIENTTTFIPGNPPEKAAEIIENAGLEAGYEHIKSKVHIGLTMPKDEDCYSNILNGGRDAGRIREYYLATVIATAENILTLAGADYPQAARDKLNTAVRNAKFEVSWCSKNRAIELRQKLQAEIEEFCNSKE